jgi:hypothetical protein
LGSRFSKAYLIYFHPTDGVQCGIGKLNSSAETLNLRKEALKRGQTVPAPSTMVWWGHMRKFGERVSPGKTLAISPQKSWNIKPSERLAIALQSPRGFVIWRSKSRRRLPRVVTHPYDGVMIEVRPAA